MASAWKSTIKRIPGYFRYFQVSERLFHSPTIARHTHTHKPKTEIRGRGDELNFGHQQFQLPSNESSSVFPIWRWGISSWRHPFYWFSGNLWHAWRCFRCELERVEEPTLYRTFTFPNSHLASVKLVILNRALPIFPQPRWYLKRCAGVVSLGFFCMEINHEKLILRCIYLCFFVLCVDSWQVVPSCLPWFHMYFSRLTSISL